MRVLHVITTAQRRGAEMFASDLIRALQPFDVEQHVAVLHECGSNTIAYDAPTVVLGNGGIRMPGIRVDLRVVRSLRGVVRDWPVDVIHAHGGEPLKYATLARYPRHTPILYRRIAEAAKEIRTGMRLQAYRRLMRSADSIVAVAEAIRAETITTFGLDADDVVTIPRGVDPSRLVPGAGRESTRAQLGIDPGDPVVLSLGALSWEKDPLAHLEASALLSRRLPRVRHLFAGDGPLREVMLSNIRTNGRSDGVTLLGTRADVADLMSAADVLLLASRTEGMPGVVIEAGLAGIPVVAFGVAGVNEVLVDGETGFIVTPGDTLGLAEGMAVILEDEDRRREMGCAARAHCLARFDIATIAPRYLALYREISV
jgi:glycosyltransferase involved in cell wall biosynthesis